MGCRLLRAQLAADHRDCARAVSSGNRVEHRLAKYRGPDAAEARPDTIRARSDEAAAVTPKCENSYAAYALYAVVVAAGFVLFLVALSAVISDVRAMLAVVALLLALKGLHMLNGGSWVGLFNMRDED